MSITVSRDDESTSLPPPPTAHPAGQWMADPDGRHEFRYFVHGQPTDLVSDAGHESLDEHGEWRPDPTGRHELRYFVQGQPTLAVSNDGVQAVDATDVPRRRWRLVTALAAVIVVLAVVLVLTRSDLDDANRRLDRFEEEAAAAAAEEAARPDVEALASEAFEDFTSVLVTGDEASASVAILYPGLEETAALEGLLDDLGFSSAVMERMALTRALDGTQTAEGDHVNASWTYHPDDGLNVVFEVTD